MTLRETMDVESEQEYWTTYFSEKDNGTPYADAQQRAANELWFKEADIALEARKHAQDTLDLELLIEAEIEIERLGING